MGYVRHWNRGDQGVSSMTFNYYVETDSLHIDLAGRPSADSRKVAPGVVLEFDAGGRLAGIDIDHASQVVNLSQIDTTSLPAPPAGDLAPHRS